MTVLTDLFAAPTTLTLAEQRRLSTGRLVERLRVAAYATLDVSVQNTLASDSSLDVLRALLTNPGTARDVRERLVYGEGPHRDQLQSLYAGSSLLPEEQVRIATEGSPEARRTLASSPMPVCEEAQRVLFADSLSGAQSLLGYRRDLAPGLIMGLDLSQVERVLKVMHRNNGLSDPRHLTYAYYVDRYPQGLERLRQESGIDSETWRALGPTWRGDLVSLIEACLVTKR